MKSFEAELGCVVSMDTIFSRREKEVFGMQEKKEKIEQQQFTSSKTFGNTRGGSPLFQEQEEGYDGWVRWLRSNKHSRKDFPIT
jgi:Zn-finger domain-containing protein